MKNVQLLVVLLSSFALILTGCPSPQVVEDEPPVPEVPEEEEEVVEEEEVEEAPGPGVLGMVATAEMIDGEGNSIGEVVFTQTEEGVQVEGTITGQEPGPKGFHVHEFGECETPDFLSAGGHFNPEGHDHGEPEAPHDQRHAGDFGNIEFDEEGEANFSFVDDVITLGEGENDIVGKALIVHEQEDDLETQPTGDAGPRAGCGLILASE